MLVFVVPVKSAQASVSWQRVTSLVRRTLRSACAQTVPDFRVVVACHDVPAVGFEDPRLEFLPVAFPPPGPDVGERRRDKWQKTLHGLRHARTFGPCHAMTLDADDCVSNGLAAHVARHPSANGWYLRRGYLHRDGMTTVHVERWRFHQWCNSSHIVRLDLLPVPHGPVESWELRHTTLAARMRERGTPLAPLPFPGAVYNVSHGDNFQNHAPVLWPSHPLRRWLRALAFQRRLTPAIRAEFGLYPLQTSTR
jgi:hypothetical protein